jgi:hypothetical protein
MEQQAERQQRKPGRWYAIITLIGVVLSGIFIAGLPASAIVKAKEQGTPGTKPGQALIPSTEPEEVITGFSPTGLVDNGDHLFVASQGYGIESCQLDPTPKTPVLRRMNYDGSGVEVLIERCVFFQKGMLADADFVYFRDGDNDLKKIAVNGGSPTTLATDTCCGGLAMDETYIYWGQWGDAGESNSIWRIAKNNGEPEFIASFSDPNNYNIYGLAVDDTDIYWAGGNIGGGIVRKLAKAGGTPQTLADISEGIDNARGIALDANYVYWTELGTGRVRRIAKSGGSVKDYLDPQEYYQAGSVAVNGAHIYWADTTGGYDGRIRRVDKSGGQIDDLVLGALGPDTVLLTDSHIYYGKSGGVYRLPLDAAGVAVDLAIDYLEVTQGIQNLANEVPLVREKPAFVRVYPRLAETHGDLHGLNVTAQLRGFRNGSELPDSPLFPVNATVFLKTQEADRMELNQTFNFWLPESWRSGTVTFQAELNPDGAVNEFNTANNVYSVVKTFNDKKPLCIEVVQVRTDPQTASASDPGFIDIIDWVRTAYPVPEVYIDIGGQIEETQLCLAGGFFPYPCGGPYEMPDDDNKVLARLGWYDLWHTHYKWQECGPAHFYGMVHPSEMNTGGLGNRPGYAAWGVMTVDPEFLNFDETAPWYIPDGGATMAHEIGHNRGRKHVDCGDPDGIDLEYPYSNCDIGPYFSQASWYGFDYLDQAVIHPATAGDLMSYSHLLDPPKPVWPSDYTYEGIFGNIPNGRGATAVQDRAQAVMAAGEVLAISGFITPTLDVAVFDIGYRIPAGLVLEEKLAKLSEYVIATSDGPYALRLLDENDLLLAEYPFALPELADGDGEAQPFMVVVPYDGQTASVALVRDGAVLASRMVSNSSPGVTVLEPNGGEDYGNAMTIRWKAGDSDGDELLYTVQYSHDNGQTWRVVAENYYTPTLVLSDTSFLPGSSGTSLVRVIATDGLNTTSDTSDRPFSLRPHRPNVYISAPDDGAIVAFGDDLTLVGSGYDVEDGALAGPALTWSIDGLAAGSGKEVEVSGLALGQHPITLKGTSSDALSAETSITVQVQHQQCEVAESRLEVVYILDTSNQVSGLIPGACQAIDQAVEVFTDMGVTVRHSVYGITAAQDCATSTIAELDPGTAVNHPADWGPAIVSVAENYDWLDGYVRMIVPISSQGPEDGDPIDEFGPDREAINQAIDAANEAGAAVSPIMGRVIAPGRQVQAVNSPLLDLARDLAEDTGGVAIDWPIAIGDPLPELAFAEALQEAQSYLICTPEVDAVSPKIVDALTTDISLFGQHLWPGLQLTLGGMPVLDAVFAADGRVVSFKWPADLPPGLYPLRLERPGLATVNVAEEIGYGVAPYAVYLPLVVRP